MVVVEAGAFVRITFLLLWLGISLPFSGLFKAEPQHQTSPEVVIPLRVTGKGRGIGSPGWLSYSLRFGGQRHVVHMRVKRLLISTHLPVFTYSEQHALQEDHPFVPEDCFYHGFVEGDPESLVALSTCYGGFRGMLKVNDLSYEIEPMRHSTTFEHLVSQISSDETHSQYIKCGLKEEDIPHQHLEFEKAENPPLKQNPADECWTHTSLFLEFFVVADLDFFTYSQSNFSKVQEDIVLIVNIVDFMYQKLSVCVILIGIEVWNQGNAFLMRNMRQILEDFSQWKQIRLSQLQHDAAHIFIKNSLMPILGLAYVAGICRPPRDCGVCNFQGDTWSCFANTVAHELGHILGMQHDEKFCFCGEPGCIMSTLKVPADRFTNCSYADFMNTSSQQGSCLHDIPRPEKVFLLKRCGNGIVERDEECDCGSIKQCEQDPCCLLDCKLKPGAACAFGLCCKDCKFMPLGEVCRQNVNECDLPEWCNGTSHQCPEDRYVQNGSPCSDNGYCYEKRCNNHDQQCREIFGKGSKSASQNCYKKINTEGNRFGHCGKNGTVYLKCNPSDIFCGRVQCENVESIPNLQDKSAVQLTHIDGVSCWSFEHYLGMGTPDIGEVKDGTVCGTGKICIHRKCVNISVMSQICLPETCNNKGICNNKHHCHCGYGWSPPYCLHRGYGGSVDSGPATSQGTALLLQFGIISLSVLIVLLIAGLCMYFWKPFGLKTAASSG
ncbi:disintegrin and metalloproteinase domain-containing protein 21-like [Ochotona curzoniae]|uniref:disintegrin and metalloproteinase domain-containing protein 21-like n=1 Tax=Ochotona curzoniae TaxID=130825 RepID=UPI001B34C60D|nr:disintegrin and metalloproteinase domain-containing protein 21-like [Ochotona curzoniae]